MFVLLSCLLEARDLEALRQVELDAQINEDRATLGDSIHQVFALAFSPDDRSLAVAIGSHETSQGPIVHVIVLDTTNYKKTFQSDISALWITKLQWSGDGSRLLVQAHEGSWILDPTHPGVACDIGDSSNPYLGFILPNIFAVAKNYFTAASLKFYNTNCQRAGEALLSLGMGSSDSDADHGLFASAPFGNIDVYRVQPWVKLMSIADRRQGLRITFFGGSQGICASPYKADGDASLRCWTLDSGTAHESTGIKARNSDILPVAKSRSGSLLAFQYTALTYNPFTEGGTAKFKRWFLWDPLLGQERGSVPPRKQTSHLFGDRRPAAQVPFVTALSSASDVFAIAGGHTLELFRVQ